jgi:hypothetical protein
MEKIGRFAAIGCEMDADIVPCAPGFAVDTLSEPVFPNELPKRELPNAPGWVDCDAPTAGAFGGLLPNRLPPKAPVFVCWLFAWLTEPPKRGFGVVGFGWFKGLKSPPPFVVCAVLLGCPNRPPKPVCPGCC